MRAPRLRLGLCCQFVAQPIKFRTTTATALARLTRRERLAKVGELCLRNANALRAALAYAADNGIGSFRIASSMLPVKTHPTVGYDVEELPNVAEVVAQFRRCGDYARAHNLRTGFHPDQFVVLNSPDPEIVRRAVADLVAQAEVAEWTNADTINIHVGGAYGDKAAALARFFRSVEGLPATVRTRLTVENDDRTFTPADLAKPCRTEGLPLVYDVHPHRCCPDGWSVEQATEAARATWKGREPLFHISSPLAGWKGPQPSRHHDYIDIKDFPPAWRGLTLTVEVEAKAKELAVAKLQRELTEAVY